MEKTYRINRNDIVQPLKQALKPLPFVHAMWEAGAAAFNRVDQWSDIDLMVDVDDERTEEVFSLIQQTLTQISPIEIYHRLPEPTWHGHSQAFIRLSGTSEFLMIDLVVLKHSNSNKFLQTEIHGQPLVHFDKSGIVQSQPLNKDQQVQTLLSRLDSLRTNFALFQPLTLKEINRGNHIEAISFFYGFTLRPLVEALRIRYSPYRYNFHTRYVYYDLPQNMVKRLESLFFVSNPDEIRKKHEEAGQWFYDTIGEISKDTIIKSL